MITAFSLHQKVAHTLADAPDKWGQYVVLLLFLVILALVYVSAAVILSRKLLKRPGRPRLRQVILGLASFGILCFCWGYVEADWIEVSRIRITSSKVSSPVRILHVTDTHCDDWGKREERLLEIVRQEKPDVIVFTGDSINNPGEGLKAFRRLGESLQAPSGCFAVGGNWDVW